MDTSRQISKWFLLYVSSMPHPFQDRCILQNTPKKLTGDAQLPVTDIRAVKVHQFDSMEKDAQDAEHMVDFPSYKFGQTIY